MKALQTPGECCPGCEHSLACLSRGEKYCHNGGMASPTITASACLGVQDGDHGPFRRSLASGCFAGKQPAGSGFSPDARSTGPTGANPFASSLTAASSGSKNAMMAPFARSPKGLLCRAKAARVRGPRLWGSDGLVCLAAAGRHPEAAEGDAGASDQADRCRPTVRPGRSRPPRGTRSTWATIW